MPTTYFKLQYSLGVQFCELQNSIVLRCTVYCRVEVEIVFTNHFPTFPIIISAIYRWNVTIKAIVYYFLPLTLIGVLYLLMARRLQLSAREMPGELAGPQSKAQARARRHVARMVVTFVIG